MHLQFHPVRSFEVRPEYNAATLGVIQGSGALIPDIAGIFRAYLGDMDVVP